MAGSQAGRESCDEGEEGRREESLKSRTTGQQGLVTVPSSLAALWEREGPGGCNSVTNVQQALGTRYTSTHP